MQRNDGPAAPDTLTGTTSLSLPGGRDVFDMSIGASDPNDRSGLAVAATVTALVGGAAKGLVFDRPRIAFAYAHARDQGKTAKWLVELATGHATNDIVPITGGTIRIGSKTLTQQAWKRTYQASNVLTLTLVGVHMLYGIPNLVDGIRSGGGIEGVLESRAGRTGVMATISGLVELGLLGFAFSRSGGSGMGRAMAALGHPIHSNGLTVLARIGMSLPIMANEAGFLDFLNRGNDDDWIENARNTVAGHVDTVRDVFDRD